MTSSPQELAVSRWLLGKQGPPYPRCPNTGLASHVILLPLVDGDRILPLCAAYRLPRNPPVGGKPDFLHSSFVGELISMRVLFLSLISSPGMLIPFALGTVCEVVKPFNVGKL